MKKNKTINVLVQEDFDRIVFCTRDENHDIVGINFHQGCERENWDFASPCPALTDIYERLKEKGTYSLEEEVINKSIEMFNQAFIFQDEFHPIPLDQSKLIQKALDFYVEASRKLNSVPTETEEYEYFDMQQLSALMRYSVNIKLTDDDKKNFTRIHGMDLPSYVE